MDGADEADERIRGGVAWAARNETRHYFVKCLGETHVFTVSASSGPWFIDHHCGSAQLAGEAGMRYGPGAYDALVIGGCALFARGWELDGITRVYARTIWEKGWTEDVEMRLNFWVGSLEDPPDMLDGQPPFDVPLSVRTTQEGAQLLLRLVHAVPLPSPQQR